MARQAGAVCRRAAQTGSPRYLDATSWDMVHASGLCVAASGAGESRGRLSCGALGQRGPRLCSLIWRPLQI